MGSQIVLILVAVAKAFPVVKDWINQAAEQNARNDIQEIKDENYTKKIQRHALLIAISEAKDHKQKAILFTALNNIHD